MLLPAGRLGRVCVCVVAAFLAWSCNWVDCTAPVSAAAVTVVAVECACCGLLLIILPVLAVDAGTTMPFAISSALASSADISVLGDC